MEKLKNLSIYIFAILATIPKSSFAANLLSCIPSDDPVTGPEQLEACINAALDLVRLFGGIGFFAMGLWGGVIWATSGGSEEKIKKGRDIFTAAVIGILIIIFAPVLVDTFIKATTGN